MNEAKAITTSWISGCWQNIDDILKHSTAPNATAGTQEGSKPLAIGSCVATIIGCGFLSGLMIGSFAWLSGQKALSESLRQMVYSGVKVPLLLFAAFALSLPVFYVLNALFGLSTHFEKAIRKIAIGQAVMSVVLVSLIPLVGFYYLSGEANSFTYRLAIVLNAVAFGTASFFAQIVMRRLYRELILENRWHRVMLWFWSAVYAFNGIQMGWVLRPFIGNPGQTTTFLRSESWDNAYIKCFQIIRSLF